MKIRALFNLPGFAWISIFSSWPIAARLPTLLLVVSIGALALYFLGLPVSRIVNVIVTIAFITSTLALWIILATSAEHDLTEADIDNEKYLSMLAPTPSMARLETILGCVLGLLNLTAMHLLSSGRGLWVLELLFNPGFLTVNPAMYAFVLFAVVVMTWGGVITIHLLFFLHRHYRAYLTLSRDLPLNLFDLEPCQIVSRPLLRYWLLVVLVISMYSLFSQFSTSDSPQQEIFALAVAGPLFTILLLLSWWFIKPVWIIRERIHDLKILEIEHLKEALLGDRNALQKTHIASMADEFAAPDIISYSERVSNLWEWPIRREMQRIAFYTLIPPAAWVMAALVERMLDVIL